MDMVVYHDPAHPGVYAAQRGPVAHERAEPQAPRRRGTIAPMAQRTPASAVDPRLLLLFTTVSRARSISGAAAQVGLSKSLVSRQIARLEAELGVRLLQRTTRKLSLTEIGEEVLRQAAQIEQVLESIAEFAGRSREEVRGRLRVSCSIALGRRHVAPALPELVALHPDLSVALNLEDRFVDLIAEGFDVALRVTDPADSSLIARKLIENPRVVVAAPSYLEKHGAPTRPQKLVQHTCVLYCSGSRVFDEWVFHGPGGPVRVRVRGRLQMNDGQALVDAAVAGTGILGIDRLLVRDELERGALVEVLPDYLPESGPPIYAVYPARAWLPSKTAVFIEFVERRLKQAVAR
jgi:DNA-binding transcriptional LysR family regulator